MNNPPLVQLQQQAAAFWARQSRVQRIVLVALLVTGVGAIALFTTWAGTPTYAVAFSGLSEADAGQIVEQLANEGIDYQLRDAGTILVPAGQVYEVRLSMARQGLPEGGTVGYELFNGTTTLGMTEFTQRVNYQRALEGELERTIGSLNAVSGVRVHIVTPEKALLTSQQAPTTASITLQFRPGQTVDPAQVRAITHLVASGVENLQPENVVVVDVDGNLLAGSGQPDQAGDTAENDDRLAAEAVYAAAVQAKVRNLLEMALGPNKSVVQASVVMNWNQKDVTTQAFDPAAAVIRSAQTLTETYSGDGASLSGIPGATSNLPPLTTGDTVTGTEAALYQRYETTTNYETTQTQSHEVIAPGRVERLSLSVLVDGITDTQQLLSLRTVISAAAGIQDARGDSLAVETLAFDRSYYAQQAAALEQETQTDLYLQLAGAAAAVLLLIAVFWYVHRLLANLRLASADAWTPLLVPAAAQAGLTTGMHASAHLSQPAIQSALAAASPATGGAAGPLPEPAPALGLGHAISRDTATPQDEQVQRVMIRMAEENPATVAEVLRLWLNEDEKKK